MNPAGQTICLSMIVKNEARVIRRCLDSVRDIIDYWVIVDTGSTDGTQDIIRAHFQDVPGELVERPWRDFAQNRSEALALARPRGDYTFIIDADDALELQAGFQLPRLSADSYQIDIQDTNIRYQRTQFVSNALAWRYAGVLHEYLTCEGAGPTGTLPLTMRRNHDGARRRDPSTYLNDVAVLEAELGREADPFLISRYTFYLAQSYRDSNQPERALEAYLKRADLGYWHEETCVALLQAARLMQTLERPAEDVLAIYSRARQACPDRAAEALHGAARYCRLGDRFEEGYQYALAGLNLARPGGGLFVETWIYDYGLLDEYAVNGYWAGHYGECLDACLKILKSGKLNPADVPRIAANACFAREKLEVPPQLGMLGTSSFRLDHKLDTAPAARKPAATHPRVLIAILAKQKEPSLPLYLQCIEELDYPKSSIVLYIRTNNNCDNTELILRNWISRVGHKYAEIELDAANVTIPVENFGVHEWNPVRFKVLGNIRNISLSKTIEYDCDFYFVCDVDNFIQPCTLSEIIDVNLPIVAPLLRSVSPDDPYSNYHADIDPQGYFRQCDQYYWVLNRWVRGLIEMPVVHCTYLVRRDIIERLTYVDDTDRFEYVIFSESARKAGIPQYLDNRRIYGYIAFEEGKNLGSPDSFDTVRRLMERREASAGSVFSEIYQKKAWGESNDHNRPFYSGPGSSDREVVGKYVEVFNNLGTTLGERRRFDAVKVQCELSTSKKTISLLYTTARPHLIPEVIGRWFERDPNEIEMIVVTDDPYPATVFPGVKFLVNSGKRDCVTGWNLAAQHSRGDIIVQVSDDLYPPTEWAELIRGFIKEASKIRKDIVLNLMDERQVRDAVYHPVLTREAYEKLSYLYPPDFESMFCDNWFSAYHVKYSHFSISNGIFWCHRHRTVYKVEVDDVMRVHESPERYEKGKATFLKYVKKHRLDGP